MPKDLTLDELVADLEGRPRKKDTRKGDRHKPGRVRKPTTHKSKNKWQRRSIVAWDGEGANLEDGRHIYNLLANSRNEYILDNDGLGTLECFGFFLTNSNPNDINVIYGGSYDINMILKDVDLRALTLLWTTGQCYWMGYRIQWASRKKFTVQELKAGKIVRSFTLWDVLGFFQSTFVKACRLWLGDLPLLDQIEEMKNQRATFQVVNIDEIIAYNNQECLLLVMLINRLFASLDEAGLMLTRYDGAGSIAGAILKKYEVTKYKGEPNNEVIGYSQFAYSGGRIEAIKCGTTRTRAKIYRYDINSAYPAATLSLPSYAGAEWTRSKTWDRSNNSIVCVNYSYDNEAPFYPLWYRDNNGGISYPRQGYGMYWGAEIANLYKHYREGIDFEIEWAMNCQLADDIKPFEFMEELYAVRRGFADRGSMASESLKLGLNSVYGKLVQQAGYREGRIPTYHQLLWGGQITAYTRARMFDAAMQFPESIIAFATDAIFSTSRLDLPCSKSLGDWGPAEFTGMTIVQAGVYFLRYEHVPRVNGKKICGHDEFETCKDSCYWGEKYRGFDPRSIDREEVVRCWEEGIDYEATTSRFIGLGSALMSNDFSIWRTWQNNKSRKLDILPTGKRVAGKNKNYATGLRATRPAPNITPEIMSLAYPIKWIDGYTLSDLLDRQSEVSAKIVIDEEEDSYE